MKLLLSGGTIINVFTGETEKANVLIEDDKIIGVLDIDAPIFERFDEEDKAGLEKFVSILLKYSKI